jgi:uncharacterized membrane protein YcaP (DUF421 family)
MIDWWSSVEVVIGQSGGDITLSQMLARASLVLLIGLALVRLTTPRLFSRATPIDIVVAVIVGSNLSRTLTGNAPFIEVIVATIFLVALHATLTHIAARWRPLATLIKGRKHILAEDGKVNHEKMRACAVGERDLMAAIRAAGGSRLIDVKLATLERGGEIDVVLREGEGATEQG